jgi:hypothetical protein
LAYQPLNKKKETSGKFSKVGKDGRKKGGFLVTISHLGLSVGNTQERSIGLVFEIGTVLDRFRGLLNFGLGIGKFKLGDMQSKIARRARMGNRSGVNPRDIQPCFLSIVAHQLRINPPASC